MTLDLFHRAAREVPAYRAFLHRRNLDPATITSPDDLERVPVMTKPNYLHRYRLANLCWQGQLSSQLDICATSGSTGSPFYFPRSEELAQQYADFLAQYLQYDSRGSLQPTLAIVGFGMGVWIAGTFTTRALEIASQRISYPLSILPTGVNTTEIIKALRQLAPNYARTILIGYPPYVREVITAAEQAGVNLKRLKLRLLFAAEAFNERFRDHLAAQVGIRNVCLDTLNIYGSADIGAMAYETPLSILVRRLAGQNKALFEELFAQITKTPTLAQYDPQYIHFEAVAGNILLSGNNTLPLIRYAIGDRGGVLSYTDVKRCLRRCGIDLDREVRRAGIAKTVQRLPFVYVYERSDLAVSLYGMMIYPEFIKDALHHSMIEKYLSGRFTMVVEYDSDQHQRLTLHLELAPSMKLTPSRENRITQLILAGLQERSSEFRELSHSIKARELVVCRFWPNGDPLYFRPGGKQKWALKA